VSTVGRKRARSIARWLSESPGVGTALTAVATTPRTALTVADLAAVRAGRSPIQPLERVVVPVALSGIDGSNRERRRVCQIEVANDRDAIVRWLHGVAVNDNTFRAYSREAERVLQWCLVEKGKPLSSMTVDDAIEYREFLIALPRPELAWHWQTRRADWIGEKSHARTSPNWRPFEGRMSAASIERGLRIVRGLFAWLQEVGYLAGNPWAAVTTTLKSHTQFRSGGKRRQKGTEKSLSRAEWAAVLDVIDSMPAGERQARAALLVRLGAMAGMRREELANATTEWIEGHDKGRLTLNIVGKGGVPREVPMAADLIDALGDYLEARGLARDPTDCPPSTPLLAKLAEEIDLTAKEARRNGAGPDRRIALTPARLYAIVRRLIEQAAEIMEGRGDDKLAAQLRRRARAHALRHTFGTQCAEQGIPIPIVQDWMGHASPETTAIYFSARAGRRFDLIDKAFGGRDREGAKGDA
jgi:integrase